MSFCGGGFCRVIKDGRQNCQDFFSFFGENLVRLEVNTGGENCQDLVASTCHDGAAAYLGEIIEFFGGRRHLPTIPLKNFYLFKIVKSVINFY